MKYGKITGILALILLLVLPGAGSAADVAVSGSILKPDLSVTSITPNTNANAGSYGGELFANEANAIVIVLANTGTGEAAASTLSVDVGGTLYTASVGTIAAGVTATVSIDDPIIREKGNSVVITATADSAGVINEADETNNILSITKTAVYNGYKGKRYTGGSDLTMVDDTAIEIRGDFIYSAKAEYQSSGDWMSKTVSWTAGDLPVPGDATVMLARLSVPYNWDSKAIMPDGVSVTVNGKSVTRIAGYSDTKGFGGSAYPTGMVVYDVTDAFDPNGNSATITRTSSLNGPALNGMVLTVIYSDLSATKKVIFVNEEADILRYNSAQPWVSTEEATAYAPFTGLSLTITDVESAHLVTIAQSATSSEGSLVFNGQTFSTPWAGGSSTLGISDVSVMGYLTADGNVAEFHTVNDNDYYVATNAILIVEMAEESVTADFTANPMAGDAPLTVAFTDTSSGYIVSYAWDFDNDGVTDSTDADMSYTYTDAGTYTVKHTVTGLSTSSTKTDTVTVKEPKPVIGFTGTPTSGMSPLTVVFTAVNTGGTVNTWLWDFGDGSSKVSTTAATVSHTYTADTAKTYSVGLTANGPDYSVTKTRFNYIAVGAQTIEVTIADSALDFGTMAAGTDETGSTSVNVDVTGGTSWSVTAAATNSGYMSTGSANLASPFQLSNDNADFRTMSADFADFLAGSAGADGSGTAYVKQAISDADTAGDYSITLTFTGSFS